MVARAPHRMRRSGRWGDRPLGAATVMLGVREMVCRLNDGSTISDKTATNLCRSAPISMSGEQLRKVVLAQGQTVMEA